MQNPIKGAWLGVVAVAAAAVAAVVTWTVVAKAKTKETAVVTDPLRITEAKALLGRAALPGGGAVLPKYVPDLPFNQVTPAFTTELAAFQQFVNAKITPADLQRITTNAGTTPAFPMRTDGVLDEATFNWLIIQA